MVEACLVAHELDNVRLHFGHVQVLALEACIVNVFFAYLLDQLVNSFLLLLLASTATHAVEEARQFHNEQAE